MRVGLIGFLINCYSICFANRSIHYEYVKKRKFLLLMLINKFLQKHKNMKGMVGNYGDLRTRFII